MATDVPIELLDTVKIGENDHGYEFGVGRLGARWLGFAVGTEGSDTMLFVFSEISTGHELGIDSREKAIRMVGAIAQDGSHAYGGMDRWFVKDELRGTPEEFLCEVCGEICGPGPGCYAW